MLIRKPSRFKPSEITPRERYLSRRNFVAGMGAAGVLGASAWPTQAALPPLTKWPGSSTENLTPKEKAISYNNFYELGSAKDDPGDNADLYAPRPWKVMIDGEVNKPGEMDVEDLLTLAPLEERIYRLRCVERWSMVIPWVGFSFNKLMEKVEPTANAKYVAFETFNPNDLFPDDVNGSLPWPYVEGLRIDEAAHDLALLTFGSYGEELLTPSGAPIRMVVPWKYGYKSIKALVRISFVTEQPPTSWNNAQPSEYGFYSNVNPKVAHPRWSQVRERTIGEGIFPIERNSELFNGYDEVASLYAGMDLKVQH